MKSLIKLGLSCLVVIFFLFGFQTTFVSCTKTVTKIDTVTKTVTNTDTLMVSKDTPITAQLLASRPWKLQYIHEVSDNDTVEYTRGGSNNNVNFDSQVISFNTNFTGNVIDIVSASHTTTWDFLDQSNTSILLVVSNPSPLSDQSYIWNNMTYRNDSLLIDQYSTYQGINSQAEIIWVGSGR